MDKLKVYQKYCVGCGLCHHYFHSTVNKNSKGFLMAAETKNQKDMMEFCEQVCPISDHSLQQLDTSKIWGKDEGIYFAYAMDHKIRNRASSGGVITALCQFLLESGKVDGILHTKSSDTNPIETITCKSTVKEELINRCGSRYAVSSPLFDSFDLMEEGKKYAFVGKPCDVTALKNFIEMNQQLKDKIPYTLSFFCAGIPSKDANEMLLKRLNCSKDSCESLSYRGNGWPGYATAVDKKGKIHVLDYETAWGSILGRDLHPFCRFCMDGVGERADISCGDAWYMSEDGKPDFTEHEGRNVVFVRSKIGKELLSQATKQGNLYIEEYQSPQELDTIQAYQHDRRCTMFAKISAVSVLHRVHPNYSKKTLAKYRKFSRRTKDFKIFYGTIKRVVKGVI